MISNRFPPAQASRWLIASQLPPSKPDNNPTPPSQHQHPHIQIITDTDMATTTTTPEFPTKYFTFHISQHLHPTTHFLFLAPSNLGSKFTSPPLYPHLSFLQRRLPYFLQKDVAPDQASTQSRQMPIRPHTQRQAHMARQAQDSAGPAK